MPPAGAKAPHDGGGVVPDAAAPDAVPDPAVPEVAPLGATVPEVPVPDEVPEVAVPDVAVPDEAPLGATVPDVAVPDIAVPDDVPDVVPLGAVVPVAAFVPVAAEDPETEVPEVEPEVAGCVPPFDAQPWRRPSTASAPNALEGTTTRKGLDKFKAWAEEGKRAIGTSSWERGVRTRLRGSC